MSESGDYYPGGRDHAISGAEMQARRHGANLSSRGPGSEGRAGAIAFWIALAVIAVAVIAVLVAIDGREESPVYDDIPAGASSEAG